jgi:hypothetical protein
MEQTPLEPTDVLRMVTGGKIVYQLEGFHPGEPVGK